MKAIFIALALAALARANCDHHSCLECDAAGKCTLCNLTLHYVPDGFGGCAVHFAENCQIKDERGVCLKCNVGWTAHFGVCLKADATETCEHYGCEGTCERCKTGYILEAGACRTVKTEEANDHCREYANVGECAHCDETYYLHKGKCILAPVNCLVPSICYRCPDGLFPAAVDEDFVKNGFWDKWNRYQVYGHFGMAPNKCKENPDVNCDKAASLTKCDKCMSGYLPNDSGLCAQVGSEADNCVDYQTKDACLKCKTNFYVDQGKCVEYLAQDPNCRYFKSDVACKRCDEPYYLNDKDQCVKSTKLIDNCDWYSAEATCVQCNNEYYYDEVKKECVILSTLTENCAVYSDVCIFCKPEFYLKDSKCVPVITKREGCNRYKDAYDCAECKDTHFLDGVACLPIKIDKCVIYFRAGLCEYCEATHFAAADGSCQSLPADHVAVTNCAYYGRDGSCIVCNDRYDLINKVCVTAVIDNCDVYETANQCKYCITGYYYNSSKNLCERYDIADCYRAIDSKKCLICHNRSYLDTTTGTCVKLVDGEEFKKIDECEYYHENKDTCQRCNDGFYLKEETVDGVKNTSCLPAKTTGDCAIYIEDYRCEECTAFNFSNEAKQCEPTDRLVANCAYYRDKVCQACAENYHIVYENTLRLCLPVTTKVELCSLYEKDKCVRCQAGHVLINNVCEKIELIDNCVAYDNKLDCVACAGAYFLDNGLCVVANDDKECGRHSTIDTCIECKENFRFTAPNTCTSLIPFTNCKYAEDNTQCAICEADYVVQNGQCKLVTEITNGKKIEHCAEYGTDGSCDVCDSDFYLVEETGKDDVCVAIFEGIKNCVVFANANACELCEDKFYVNDKGRCVALQGSGVTGCEVHASDTTCKLCQDGFAKSLAENCIANCLVASTTEEKCDQCIDEFYLKDSICSKAADDNKTANCRVFNKDGACDLCKIGYLLKADLTCEQTDYDTCLIVDPTKPTCAFCLKGYALNAKGECESITVQPSNCLILNQSDPRLCDVCDMDSHHDLKSDSCMENPSFIRAVANAFDCQWREQKGGSETQ